MNILLLSSREDASYLHRFNSLLPGHKVYVSSTDPGTTTEIALKCKAGAIDALVCTNETALEKLLFIQPDFQPHPSANKKYTLNDYQGSMLWLRNSQILPGAKIPCVVLNPLEQLLKVRYGTFIAKRFLKKITAPETFFPAYDFSWRLFDPNRAEQDYNLFSTARIIALDIETFGDSERDPDRHIRCCCVTGWFPGDTGRNGSIETIVIPIQDTYNLEWLRRFSALPIPKVMQNGMYDCAYFFRWGVVPSHYLWDTQHLFHSWYSELPKRLDFITAFSLVDVRFWKDDGKSGNLQDLYRYNALDGWATLNTFLALIQEMPEWAWRNYFMEFPLVFPSFQCAMEGFLIDQQKFTQVREQKEKETELLKAKIQAQVGAPTYNPNSSEQTVRLMKILGAKDATSAEEKELKKLQATTPLNNLLCTNIIKYKKEKKLLSTYFKETKVWNGRIYYSLNPASTDTARLASRESAYDCGLQIQNIPRGDAVKQCFMADPGWRLGTGDYPQSEARCVAYISGDEKLLQLVESDKDYHSWNAQEFFGIPYEKIWDQRLGIVIDKLIRDLSKRTNHGANYNMGAQVMLDTMGPEYVQQAKELLRLPADWSLLDVCQFLLDRYAATYPRVKGDWYSSVIHKVETTHMLVSPLGWTRYCFGSPRRSKPDLNAYVAHEPQNLSVALINKAFYRCWVELQCRKFRGAFRLKAQIHDEILFQYLPSVEADVLESVKEIMTIPAQITDVGGITRTMTIHPQMSWGKQYWSQLK